jgi:hypothetical protein
MLSAAACSSDHEASVDVPREPLVRGAYFPLGVRDSCDGRGGGKAPSFCTAEDVVSVDSFSVADSRIARLMRMADFDEAEQVPGSELVIEALSPGTTDVTIEATFDDDSVRSVTSSISVLEADRLELVHFCPSSDAENKWLFPAGSEVLVTAKLFHGEQELKGEYQGVLLKGSGIARKFGNFRSNPFSYTAGKATTLTSPLIPGFSQAARGFTPEEAQILSVDLKYDNKISYKQFVGYDVDLRVGDERPCALPPLRIETQTPDVCDGDKGATSWVEEQPNLISVRGLKSGICQFTVTVEGTTTTHGIELELEVKDVPVPVVDPCDGVSCEPVESCEAGSELAKRDCCNTCVPLPNPELCEEQRASFDPLFETEHAKALDCQVDTDCSQVVLAGGCRRYCNVPVNHDLTADFMNAISEQYYTGCPSCQVAGESAQCEGSFNSICKNGRCSLAPL